jgi:hypothetical protein
LLSLAKNLRKEITYILHDYSPICPIFFCQGKSDIFCGVPTERECNECLSKHNLSPNISEWRFRKSTTLQLADKILYHTRPVVQSLKILNFDKKFEQSSIQEDSITVPVFKKSAPFISDKIPLLILGHCPPHKGSELLRSLASNPHFIFYIFGEIDSNKIMSRNIISYGAYKNFDEIKCFLSNKNVNGIFFPGRIPETYSYALSAALKTKLPIFAFNIGAFSSRLSTTSNASLLEVDLPLLKIEEFLLSQTISYRLEEVNRA